MDVFILDFPLLIIDACEVLMLKGLGQIHGITRD